MTYVSKLLFVMYRYLFQVGHEKSRLFAGCPYQRVRGDVHLFSSRGHTAHEDDRLDTYISNMTKL